MTWVWNRSQSRHGARLVLLAIADYMNSGHSWAWPSGRELARKTQLKERAVQTAIADLLKLGELEVDYNGGPKGCNRYRVLMSTPAESAPPQNLHPADNAPPQDERSGEFAQADGQDPAESAPPADSAGVQISTSTPAESAPGTVRNRKRSTSKKSAGDEPPREDVERICTYLASRVEAGGSKRPNVTETWRREARLLLDADKRTEDQVRAAVDWCQGNSFWRPKVLSMPKLREKYDQLRLEAISERERRAGGTPRRRGGQADDLTNQKYGPGSTDI